MKKTAVNHIKNQTEGSRCTNNFYVDNKLSAIGVLCGATCAKQLQKHLVESGFKDLDSIIEEDLLPKRVIQLGEGFLNFVEDFYDNNGNYTEFGLSEQGKSYLEKHLSKYD